MLTVGFYSEATKCYAYVCACNLQSATGIRLSSFCTVQLYKSLTSDLITGQFLGIRYLEGAKLPPNLKMVWPFISYGTFCVRANKAWWPGPILNSKWHQELHIQWITCAPNLNFLYCFVFWVTSPDITPRRAEIFWPGDLNFWPYNCVSYGRGT